MSAEALASSGCATMMNAIVPTKLAGVCHRQDRCIPGGAGPHPLQTQSAAREVEAIRARSFPAPARRSSCRAPTLVGIVS